MLRDTSFRYHLGGDAPVDNARQSQLPLSGRCREANSGAVCRQRASQQAAREARPYLQDELAGEAGSLNSRLPLLGELAGEAGLRGSSRPALTRVNLTIRPGEVIVLSGQSGCGKTTVTRLLNGLIPNFYSGELTGEQLVCGLPADPTGGEPPVAPPIEAYVPLVGSVFQNPKTQYFNADTTSELAFPCENMGWPSERIRARVAEVSQRFGIEHLLGRSVFTLSGGEKQRLAVAAATMLNPRLMVLDEPTSNLDARAMRDLHDMIAELKRDGVTVVIAEHRLAWCADLADRFVLFDHGTIIGDYTAVEFRAQPQQWLESQGLRALDMAPYRAIVRSKTVGVAMRHHAGADAPATVSALGEQAEPSSAFADLPVAAATVHAATVHAAASPAIIETRGLAIGYRRRFQFGRRNDHSTDRAAASTGTAAANVTAPANGADGAGAGDARTDSGSKVGKTRPFRRDIADFALYGGEIVGLMGHNGAGKSTLVRTLCGLAKPLAGRVLLHGRPARAAALTRAGFLVMQDVNYQLFADSAREELLLGVGDADDAADCAAADFAIADVAAANIAANGRVATDRAARKPPATLGELADEVLAALDLLPFAERHPMSLSGGQKQRLAIGSALMCGKELIVLDEPTSGLDRLHMMQVGALLRRLADGGRTVLVVTHDEELAALWCDRIINLDAEADAALDAALDVCADADT